MCNPSKKTIKKIMRILENTCAKDETFDIGKGQRLIVRVFTFRSPIETGFQKAVTFVPTQSILGSSLDKSGAYKYFRICSPEQIWGILK